MLIIGTEVSQNSDTQLLLNGKKNPRKGYRDLAHAFFFKKSPSQGCSTGLSQKEKIKANNYKAKSNGRELLQSGLSLPEENKQLMDKICQRTYKRSNYLLFNAVGEANHSIEETLFPIALLLPWKPITACGQIKLFFALSDFTSETEERLEISQKRFSFEDRKMKKRNLSFFHNRCCFFLTYAQNAKYKICNTRLRAAVLYSQVSGKDARHTESCRFIGYFFGRQPWLASSLGCRGNKTEMSLD